MKKIFFYLLISIPFFVSSKELNQINVGAGFGDYELDKYFDSTPLISWDAGHYSLFYKRYLDDWSIDLGYLNADKGNIFEIDVFLFSASKYIQLSERNDILIKAGINYYDYQISNATNIEQNGVGYLFGAGWQYNFDNNIGVNITYNFLGHDDLDSTSIDFSIGYSF